MKTLDEADFMIPGFKNFVTGKKPYVEPPEVIHGLFQDIVPVTKVPRKIFVTAEPSEHKAAWKYHYRGGVHRVVFEADQDEFEED